MVSPTEIQEIGQASDSAVTGPHHGGDQRAETAVETAGSEQRQTRRPLRVARDVVAGAREILMAARLISRPGGEPCDRELVTAVVVLLALAVVAAVGPLVWRVDPNAIALAQTLQPPSLEHPMGTDNLGRDVLSRFLYGARISLAVGALVALTGAVLGGALGLIAGMFRGRVDAVLTWAINSVLAFPALMLAMAVAIALGAGIQAAVIGLIIASIPWYARILRSDVLRVAAQPFIEATYAIGTTKLRLMARHVVPHVLPTLLIQTAAVFGWAILGLAALGFIGLGAQVPTPEWGAMITEGLQYALTGQWWIGVFPGIGVLVAVTAATVIADRGREILDPRGEYSGKGSDPR